MAERRITVGEISGAFGVKGWVKVRSFTEPPENILKYTPWMISSKGESREVKPCEGRVQAGSVVVRLEDLNDRDSAQALRKFEISVARDQFPKPKNGEYYQVDLIGLLVKTVEGLTLGRVMSILETGANDVLVVQGEREHLVPFVQGIYVKAVCLDQGELTVDWDPEF